MKKISIMTAALLLGVITACDSDRDDNPVLLDPSSFTMNTPAYAGSVLDLAVSSSLELKAREQPAYGFPTQVTYGAEMSLDNSWTDSAAIYTLDATNTSLTVTVDAEDMDKGIMTLGGFTDASQIDDSEPMTVYLRMTACPTNIDEENTIYSNAEAIQVYPYYLELTNAEPVIWWLIGGSIGDGSWTNNAKGEDTYKSVFPMSIEEEYEYNAKTGLGEIENTLYLTTDGSCKLISTLGSWTEQWGMTDGAFVKNDGGSGNITVSADGYYLLRYNTANDEVTLTETDAPAATYSSVSLIGTINGTSWDTDFEMSAANGTAGSTCHLWSLTITITDDCEFKLRADDDWTVNWGLTADQVSAETYGFGVNNGDNISIAAGSYAIYFDDVAGLIRIVPMNL